MNTNTASIKMHIGDTKKERKDKEEKHEREQATPTKTLQKQIGKLLWKKSAFNCLEITIIFY